MIQAIEMLKAIEVEFRTKRYLISKWVILINRYSCERITKIIEGGMDKIYKMKAGNIQTNALSMVSTILESYKGGFNTVRKTVIQHCLNLVNLGVY